ncbi:endonuclease domain-containing protein [Roseococcus sp.]|uniref:endonuclease domain-containing protein n=1 Tax=Roseococcus sp. TaxID=2109646 RepID=UPI003BAD7C83
MYQYYKLTREDRIALFRGVAVRQICQGRSESTRLVAGHCHKTGYVRGLICERCNSWLGILESKRQEGAKKKYLDRIKRRYGIPESALKSLN